MPWTFFDYVSSNGSNKIEAWLATLPDETPVRARLLAMLLYQQYQPLIRGKNFESLQGLGMFEIKLSMSVEYRLLAWYGPGQRDVTLLVGAREHNNRYRPPNFFQLAERRRDDILANRGEVTPTCLLPRNN